MIRWGEMILPAFPLAGLFGPDDADEPCVVELSRFAAPTAAPTRDWSGPRVGLKNSEEDDAWKNGLAILGPRGGEGELGGVFKAVGTTPSGGTVVPVVISVAAGLGCRTKRAVGAISRISFVVSPLLLPLKKESSSSPVGRGLPSPAMRDCPSESTITNSLIFG